jgi:hypothetical protein
VWADSHLFARKLALQFGRQQRPVLNDGNRSGFSASWLGQRGDHALILGALPGV